MNAPASASRELQRAREAAELATHTERIEWLTQERLRWSCGTPVDTHTRHALLAQNRAALARVQGGAK